MENINYVVFRQHRDAAFKKVRISKNFILRILTGSKIIWSDEGIETIAKPGEFVYLRHGEIVTIGNFVGDAEIYQAEGIIVDDTIITAFLRVHPNSIRGDNKRAGPMSAAFTETYSRLVESLKTDNLSRNILFHRTHELLLWLREAGAMHRTFWDKNLSDQLKTLIENDIERAWKASEVARELGMSEATLRRALNKEGTSFSEQLRETRLAYALMLIQTTHQSLVQIALQCGFSSQSRLSEAFKHRFDIAPSKMRGVLNKN